MRRLISGAVIAAGLLLSAPASALNVYGIDLSGRLVTFDSAAPGTITSTTTITGAIGAALLGIDFRPATGELFALGGNSVLYTINTSTGAATQIGTGFSGLSGSNFGFDFNPLVDRIRVVSDSDQNLRLNPVTGGIAGNDVNLTYADGSADSPSVAAVAYTNSFAGATTTTLYGLDFAIDRLTLINPPNNGTMTSIGALGVDIDADSSFDIASSGEAFISSGFDFYSLNLSTGQAALIGRTQGLRSIAVSLAAAPVPEPTSWAMMVAGFGAIGWATRRRPRKVAVAAA